MKKTVFLNLALVLAAVLIFSSCANLESGLPEQGSAAAGLTGSLKEENANTEELQTDPPDVHEPETGSEAATDAPLTSDAATETTVALPSETESGSSDTGTEALPAEKYPSGFLFGDERYKVEVVSGEGGIPSALKIVTSTGSGSVDLGGDRVNFYIVAYKLRKGNIRVTAFSERVVTDADGQTKYFAELTNFDLTGTEIYTTTPYSSVAAKAEGAFSDADGKVAKCIKDADEAFRVYSTEGAEFLIVLDYSSDRPDAENRYMTQVPSADPMNWKIAKSIGTAG